MAENYFETDGVEDVSGSIRHAIRTAEFIDSDAQAWKWVTLALHSALQGACVCHLTTTASPVGAVTKSNAGEWLDYFEESHTNPNMKPPKTVLMALPELLKAVRKPNSAGGSSHHTLVEISDSELVLLKHFHHGIRNQFVHFELMGWTIEVSGMPAIAQLIARVIKDIQDCGWAFRHQKPVQRLEMKRCLEALALIKLPE